MEHQYYRQDQQMTAFEEARALARHTAKAFLWMFAGLGVTFAVAYFGYASGAILSLLIRMPYAYIALAVLEVVVVMILASAVHKLPVTAARLLFFAYAVLSGLTFATLFFSFEASSLIYVFAVTSLYFGAMALFGYYTSLDLSRIRNIVWSGLLFLVLFGVISLFIPSFTMLDRLYCLVGIAVFMAFTAADTQKMKELFYSYAGDAAMLKRASIYAALQLYLDFINLFLYFVRIMGKRRD